ncbi:jg4523 [Pararge aegeria aegeria]|uniref:Jg4523 protein n=1 Tax=Pararge aegeria aegeria TaxID=348720 RepID=A0A8S4QU25_9NEOP|nr:jg4523 [Pararge aegeria aegeria]
MQLDSEVLWESCVRIQYRPNLDLIAYWPVREASERRSSDAAAIHARMSEEEESWTKPRLLRSYTFLFQYV